MAEDLLGHSVMATMMCDQVISTEFKTLALGVVINHSRDTCSSAPQFSSTEFLFPDQIWKRKYKIVCQGFNGIYSPFVSFFKKKEQFCHNLKKKKLATVMFRHEC